MMGRTTSAKPPRSSSSTTRRSTVRRRAASSISSGRTPVGYLNLVGINKKPLPGAGEEVGSDAVQCFAVSAPSRFGAQVHPSSVVIMVMVHVSEVGVHLVARSLETRRAAVKFRSQECGAERRLGGCWVPGTTMVRVVDAPLK